MSIQDGTLLKFGIDSPTTAYGIVQSATFTDSVNRATCKAPDGKIVAIQEFGEMSTMALEYFLLSASTDDPVIGELFEFAGSTWHIDDVTAKRTVDAFEVYSVNASYYAGSEPDF